MKRTNTPTTLGACQQGDVCRLTAPLILSDVLILNTGELVLVTSQDRKPSVTIRWNQDGQFIGPTHVLGNAPCEVVSTLADRRGAVADGQPVVDAMGAGK